MGGPTTSAPQCGRSAVVRSLRRQLRRAPLDGVGRAENPPDDDENAGHRAAMARGQIPIPGVRYRSQSQSLSRSMMAGRWARLLAPRSPTRLSERAAGSVPPVQRVRVVEVSVPTMVSFLPAMTSSAPMRCHLACLAVEETAGWLASLVPPTALRHSPRFTWRDRIALRGQEGRNELVLIVSPWWMTWMRSSVLF